MNTFLADDLPVMTCPDSLESAGEKAMRKVEQYESSSTLVKPEQRGNVQSLCWDDIEVGRLLDKGSFSCVYEATLLRDRHRYDPPPLYAVKCLRENVTEQEDTFVTGAVDLAVEANILAKLMHRNVIRLHGSHSGCISESFQHGGRGFFLLLDLLVDTLDKRILRWHYQQTRPFFSFRSSKQNKRSAFDRVENVALGVAEGLEYIHSRKVLYRDLKPANIGFDEAGDVRIFDFGLAREADCKGFPRQMTGNAGTPRYMAPEVAAGKNDQISYASDVYSYSIVLWEILTLEKPFESIKSLPQFNEEVVRRHARPPLNKVPSPELRNLLEECWDKDPEKRPDFSEVCRVLRKHVPPSDASNLQSSDCCRSTSHWQTSANEVKTGKETRNAEPNQSDPSDMQTSNTTTSTLMSSGKTSGSESSVELRSSRLSSFWPWNRKMSERQTCSCDPVVDRHYKERGWVQRNLLRKPTMSLDLSTRSFRIRRYDLGKPGSFRSCESVQSSNEGISAGSGSRRSSRNSDSNIEAMAATLAAEAKSNRQFLRELKRDKGAKKQS